MGVFDYVLAGITAALTASPIAVIFGVPISISVVMVLCGLLTGIVVGAIPGLSGPFAMAVSLPILISIFGFSSDALLPVLGFLIGVMKGATVGGAVPAILFNTPGTPDALLTTLDGFPMTQKGQSGKALRVAWFSSATGDTFSDIVLFTTAPFLAVVVGRSVLKGLLAALFGLFVALIAHGEDTYPRLSLGIPALREGIPLISAVVGVLILGEVFKAIEDLRREQRSATKISSFEMLGDNKLRWADIRRIAPNIGVSALIGTIIGALPGIGSTLAATMGYEAAKQMSKTPEAFGTGIPEGVAATEAANSAVSGANLIPVLSLGIPGNVAAVFIILAMESVSGFNPGPGVFRFNPAEINRELVTAFGLFTLMMLGNLLNWTIGGVFMRATGVLIRIPKQILLPVVLLLTLTSVYVEKGHMSSVVIAVIFGFVGYLMRRLEVSVLPFVISFILAANLETSMRQAFAASGSDPWFMFKSPIAVAFLMMIAAVIYWFGIRPRRGRHLTAAIQNAKGD